MIGLAFSGGPRTCIGKHLALLESKIAMIKILQRYETLEEVEEREIILAAVTSYKNNDVKLTKY